MRVSGSTSFRSRNNNSVSLANKGTPQSYHPKQLLFVRRPFHPDKELSVRCECVLFRIRTTQSVVVVVSLALCVYLMSVRMIILSVCACVCECVICTYLPLVLNTQKCCALNISYFQLPPSIRRKLYTLCVASAESHLENTYA